MAPPDVKGKRRVRRLLFGVTLLAGIAVFAAPAAAADNQPEPDQDWALHAQETLVYQANARFRSPYEGPNSLDPAPHGKETWDVTAYAGVRPWKGAEIWVDPEVDQGYGLSNTLGAAGFPSGEAYKVGSVAPYLKLPRWFLRQTIGLGGESEKVDADLTQLRGHQDHNRLVLTVGKFSVVDVFDTNEQAHDPRSDFMNWTIIDAGTFDYAANAWGYTYGAAAELYRGDWTFRAGAFDLSKVPNSEVLDPRFAQYEMDGEIEHRHAIGGHPGKLKVTLFLNHGRMGRFGEAFALAQMTGGPADISAVRRMQSRAGLSFNLEQEVSDAVSVFAKGGIADGAIEPYEFTDVDRTVAVGTTLKGRAWGRPHDEVGVAAAINGISRVHERFLDAGGLGILVGDGKLPHPGIEEIVEAYYDLPLIKPLHLTVDAQLITHPAYNRDRGPVPIGGVRLHWQF